MAAKIQKPKTKRTDPRNRTEGYSVRRKRRQGRIYIGKESMMASRFFDIYRN